MRVELRKITVQELTEGYLDNDEEGVVGYAGRLDIRPPYQREFVYNEAQRAAVIDTLTKGFPLNIMYWAVRENGEFEIIDGQQRTVSICQFVDGDFGLSAFGVDDTRYFHNLHDDEKERVLGYELMVYLCSGDDSEKLDWFKTVNIAGVKLSDQELRNAVYAGSWVTDAKRYFSKTGCPAYGLGSDYMSGTVNRQEYLETAIKWISDGDITGYMAQNQHGESAEELWAYFVRVIEWVKAVFPTVRTQMKHVEWGNLYNEFKDTTLDPVDLESRVSALIADDDVTKKSGVYPYVLDGNESHLNIRAFTDNQKAEAFERQRGVCPMCRGEDKSVEDSTYEFGEMEADHIRPWHDGGPTEAANCQMLCRAHNRQKSGV